jgi:prepilin-type N-terminal cleavage/methylation domain-containing protein
MKKIFTKIRHNGELKGFTLAEVLITLGIIGVIAALTMPALIQNHNDRAAVVKVKKMYSVIANAVHLWQVEEGCDTDVADCLDKYDVVDCKNAFAGIESKLRIADRRYQNQPVANVNWLPETSRGLDGTQTYWAWSGLSKNSVNREMVCHYLFHDGTTMMVHMPDT